MHSIARSSFIWVSNVTHDPNDSTDTLIPVRPSRRYSISCVMARTLRRRSAADGDAASGHHRLGLGDRCARRSGRSTPPARRRRRRRRSRRRGARACRRRRWRSPARRRRRRPARVSSRSKPSRVPSRSIDVSRISPAPRRGAVGRPRDGVDARRRAPAVEVHLEPAAGAALGVDRAHDALGAELGGDLGDQLGPLRRRRC